MKKPLSVLVIFCLVFLASCGANNTENSQTNQSPNKQAFTIKTEKLDSFKTDITSEKTAIIQANSTLSIPAESAGTVASIHFKEWQNVRAGATIINLSDSVTNYDLALKQAQNSIEMQDANAQTSIINIDNQIVAAKAQYDRAQLSYNQLIDRNNLKYNNVVQKNKDTLKTYDDTYKNQLLSLEGMMNQYLYDADKILGMTQETQYANNAWEPYLWWINSIGTTPSKNGWNTVYAQRGIIRKKIAENTNFIDGNTTEQIELISQSYTQLRSFADVMIEMLQNNVHGGGLSQEMTAAWLQQWNGARSAIQNAEMNFSNWKTQTSIFLDSYKKTELATKLAVETQNRGLSGAEFNAIEGDPELKLNFENASLEVKEAIANAKLTLDQAQESLKSLEELKNATQKQLVTSRQNAELSLLQAQRNASKLAIKAPINGTITKILAEVGQNVNAGTVMVEFAGNEAQAVIEVDPRVALFLTVGQEVPATINNETITGKISAVSTIANANMLSTVRIAFNKADKYIGQAATIRLTLPENIAKSFLLPINAVKIIAEGQGEIQTFVDGNIVSQKVQLGAMYGASIEVFSELPAETIVILSDVSQYNSKKQTLSAEAFTRNSQ